MPSNEQHNSSGTCEQQRGHPLPSSRRIYFRALAVVPKARNSDKCPAHTRKVQHNCGQGVKAIFRYKRMANRPPDNQAFPEGLQHRSVCLTPDCTSSQIRQLETRPQCHLHRCHDTRLGSAERLRFPTFLSDPRSSEEGIPGQGRPCPSRSSMAGTTLVACSPELTDKTSSDDPKPQTPTQGPGISSDSTSNVPRTHLAVFHISGNTTKQKAFLRTLQKYCSQQLDQTRIRHTNLPGDCGAAGVLQGKLILFQQA